MYQINTVVIDFEEGRIPVQGPNQWKLHITRDNNSSALIFSLHWNDKPQHFGVHDIKDFMKAMEPLLKEQVTT